MLYYHKAMQKTHPILEKIKDKDYKRLNAKTKANSWKNKQ